MDNIEIDIETLGTSPGCVVLSIGAVEFDDDKLGKEFEINICPESSCIHGLTIEPRTVLWWLEQNEQARLSLIQRKTVQLDQALLALHKAFDWKNKKVWCNGANFDFPILEAAMKAVGVPTPWLYYNTMDFRTLKNLLPRTTYNELKVEPTVAHNALADAKAQALTTINILKHLRGE